jgi:hypothetical protein
MDHDHDLMHDSSHPTDDLQSSDHAHDVFTDHTPDHGPHDDQHDFLPPAPPLLPSPAEVPDSGPHWMDERVWEPRAGQ